MWNPSWRGNNWFHSEVAIDLVSSDGSSSRLLCASTNDHVIIKSTQLLPASFSSRYPDDHHRCPSELPCTDSTAVKATPILYAPYFFVCSPAVIISSGAQRFPLLPFGRERQKYFFSSSDSNVYLLNEFWDIDYAEQVKQSYLFPTSTALPAYHPTSGRKYPISKFSKHPAISFVPYRQCVHADLALR